MSFNGKLASQAADALNRLAKWRTIFVGWQLGTRPKGDPEADAVRDHREATLMQRADINALLGLLVKKGVFTEDEWFQALITECEMSQQQLEQRFPGVKATDVGLTIDAEEVTAKGTFKGWKP